MGQKSEHNLAGSSTSSVSQGCNLHISQGWGLIWKLPWEGFTSKLTPLLAGFSSLWVIGLRAPVSYWPLPRGRPQFPATWASPTWLLVHQERASWESNTESLLVRCTVIFSNLITEVAFPQCWSILLARRGQVYTGCEYKEAKITGAILWVTYNTSH